MKKLMTMLSAAALAFGLRAADTGTSFEGMEAGPLDTASSIGELTAPGEGQSYWSATNENCAATVVEGKSVDRNAQTSGDEEEFLYPEQFRTKRQERYLNIKTTFGNPLERKVLPSDTMDLPDGSFYIDTLVRFTIFDSAPTFDNVAYGGAKLMVWMQEMLDDQDEPTGVTNLFVRAGYVGGDAKTYDLGAFVGDPTAWHRLTVKAIDNIYTQGIVPGFVVFIDNQAVGSLDQDNGIDSTKVADKYAAFLQNKSLFPSMTTSRVLEGVAFDGQGDVDDIIFTATQPFAAAKDDESAYVTLAWDSHVKGLTYQVNDGAATTPTDMSIGSVKIVYSKGSTVKLAVTGIQYEEGFMGSATLNATLDDNNTGVTISSAKAAAKFGDTSYATMSEALAAAMKATVSGTLKLFADYDSSDVETEFVNGNCVITLDLAGKTFIGVIGVYDGGSLIIIDTVGGGTVEGLVGADGGTLEIQGGKYKVKDDEGEYLETLNTFATEGKIFELDGGYYVLTVPKVAQIGADRYETLAAAVDAAYSGDTITMIANATFDAQLVIAKELTLNLADAEVKWTGDMGTYPIVISNGYLTIQATTTNEDVAATGALVKETASATLIRVGLPGAGKDSAAEDWVAGTAGTLIINGGTFKAPASNVIKVEKGSLMLNGGRVENTAAESSNYRGIRAAKANGVLANEVTITVNGGTIVAADPLNQEAADHGTITIPSTSTAKFSKDVSAFCEEGYETVLKDGFYVVQAKGSEPEPEVKPIEPGTSTESDYDTEEDAKNAAAAINTDKAKYITAPEGVTDAAAYAALFEATASGTKVTVDLTVAATAQIQASVDTEIKKIKVSEIAAATGDTEQTITTVPGLYYSVISGGSLKDMSVTWCDLATDIEKKIPLSKVEGATSGFYKIQATVQKVPVAE